MYLSKVPWTFDEYSQYSKYDKICASWDKHSIALLKW